jgi:hypothetical protein
MKHLVPLSFLACFSLQLNSCFRKDTSAAVKHIRAEGNYSKGIKLVASIVEYSLPTGKIYWVDMIHVAPRKFYADVARNIKTIVAQNPGTMLLQEGVGCSDSFLALRDPNAFDPQFLKKPGGEYYLPEEVPPGVIETLLTKGAIERVKCRAEVKGINDTYEALAQTYPEEDLIDQDSEQDTIFADIPKERRIYSDIDKSKLPDWAQLALMVTIESVTAFKKDAQKKSPTFVLYRRIGPGFYSWVKNEESKPYLKAVDEAVILEMRNQLLYKNINSHFAAGQKAVVVPWGAAHQKGIEKILAENKILFQKKEIAKIDVGDCLEIGNNKTTKLKNGFIGSFCISHIKDLLTGKEIKP